MGNCGNSVYFVRQNGNCHELCKVALKVPEDNTELSEDNFVEITVVFTLNDNQICFFCLDYENDQ